MSRHLVAVDIFAGGGGASEGIRAALGAAPIVAINHCEHAIRMHAANHPFTLHFRESVYTVRPEGAVRRGAVDLLWASPDCTHFSRAKGATPRSKEIRSLAWVVVDWARDIRPRVICLENVPEFQTWGPLTEDGQADKASAGETFRAFIAALRALGYAVEWRVLCAADYGAPTSRRRLFLVARCDGEPIRWPEPTHGPGSALPWRTAAECIDWTIPCLSIFDRKRPLAEATQRRIAEGIRRYVLTSASPYLLCLTHGGRLEPLTEPLRTTTTAHRGERALVAPVLARAHSHGWDANGSDTRPVDRPGWTVTAKDGAALVAAFLAKHYGGVVGQPMECTLGTVTAVDHHSLAAVWLDKLHGSARAGQSIDTPAPTVTSGGGRGGGHVALCAAFLLKYYGQGGQWSDPADPMHTLVSKARMGLVTVAIEGEEYVLTDIGMRMLQPRELARAQGFPESYILTGNKSEQVARIGNSVCPPVAEALVRAQFPEARARSAA